MAITMAVLRPFHLAVVCLALLPHTTTLEPAAAAAAAFFHRFLPHRATNVTTALPPYASVLTRARDTPSTGTGWPASTHHHHDAPAPPCGPTLSNASPSLGFDVSAVASEDTTASTPTTPTVPPQVHALHAAVDAIVPAPGGVTCTRSATTPTKKALLHALPLLAIPFLPPPLAVLVALSTLASPVSARLSEDCFKLTHGTCAVYPYDAETWTIDRANPVAGMRSVCLHPLCQAGSLKRNISVACGERNGRWGDPLHAYCTVHSLEAKGDAWVIHPAHLPVADPDAIVASGGKACYVELAHLNYREGYFIRCPAWNCRHVPHVSCTEFPPDAVASAVWEHRRWTYRDTVGPQFVRYNYDTVAPHAV